MRLDSGGTMRKIKSINLVLFLLGIGFCIYGWLQLGEFGADSSVYEYLYMKRVAKQYVFLILGVIMIFIGFIIDKFAEKVDEEINFLNDKIIELKKQIEDMKS